ncbi:MAG: glycoside hydrolase family 3 C-terminal domain-containing protein [Oscillospiraceae bacterium]|nr:glycoside hydrolase family 3 C-terminal domain-containing protein [Oscillospiraceae bacterium]
MNKIEILLTRLTLEEKIGMIHGAGIFETAGVPRLGIPPLKFSDGPMGVRNEFMRDRWVPCGKNDAITYLPSGGALAATWNVELAYKQGQVLGAEARGRGKDVILGPGINIKRTPLCGRNFEYMSEDPHLIAQITAPLIRGIQESDVAACVKHFAVNNQETKRMTIDVKIDEKALREIYLPGFEAAVKEGKTHTVMCAYNKFRGHYAGHSTELLDRILRDEWGFEGAVVSDWGAVHDTEEAAKAGMDIEMSYTSDFDDYYFAKPLLAAVCDGRVSEADIDKKVLNVLRLMEKLNMFSGNRKRGCYNIPEHRKAAYNVAAESIILLKNEGNLLPLNAEKLKKLLIVGDNAARFHAEIGGSAELKVLYEIHPLLGISGRLGGNCEVTYARGYAAETYELFDPNTHDISPELNNVIIYPPKPDEDLREEAIKLAGEHENVIFIGGLNHLQDRECFDREDMILPYRQDELIERLLAVNPNMIIVMHAGSPVDMSRWANRAKAIMWSYYAGCEGGHALADVLLGGLNPSGHLPETFAVKLTDYAAHSIGEFPGGEDGKVRYLEGDKVGYRHFDAADIEPLFPFGHGLSYTQFELSEFKVYKYDIFGSHISCKVENIGNCDGKVTVQLYVGENLRVFKKITLSYGKQETLKFTLTPAHFAHHDGEKWVAPLGKHEIRIGFSSRDIRLKGTVNYE